MVVRVKDAEGNFRTFIDIGPHGKVEVKTLFRERWKRSGDTVV